MFYWEDYLAAYMFVALALPLGALPCVMKAQMRSLIAVVIAPC